jgi:hypothetical protein
MLPGRQHDDTIGSGGQFSLEPKPQMRRKMYKVMRAPTLNDSYNPSQLQSHLLSNPPPSFKNRARIAARVEDRQDHNYVVVQKEKDRVRKVRKVQASDIGKAYGVAERVGQKHLIGRLHFGDESLTEARTLSFVPFGSLGHVGLKWLAAF